MKEKTKIKKTGLQLFAQKAKTRKGLINSTCVEQNMKLNSSGHEQELFN